jgi:putative ABC transport system substrate-binding protein
MREFIAGLGSAAAWPIVVRAQQPAMPVIGWLDAVPGSMELSLPLFTQGLAETGYVVGPVRVHAGSHRTEFEAPRQD